MKEQTKAKIFLADERGCDETNWFRSCNTFNYGKYFNEYKCPFAGFYMLNDNTIAGNQSFNMDVDEDSQVLLLPLVGSVAYTINQGKKVMADVGQLHIFQLYKGAVLAFLNCYENELNNFIQVRTKADPAGFNDAGQLFNFDLEENKNRLIKITGAINAQAVPPVLSIGKFTGRKEAVYTLQDIQNNLFVFVIQGVFEVQGILLHARDGLGFSNQSEYIELEALSNDAIVLIMEVSI